MCMMFLRILRVWLDRGAFSGVEICFLSDFVIMSFHDDEPWASSSDDSVAPSEDPKLSVIREWGIVDGRIPVVVYVGTEMDLSLTEEVFVDFANRLRAFLRGFVSGEVKGVSVAIYPGGPSWQVCLDRANRGVDSITPQSKYFYGMNVSGRECDVGKTFFYEPDEPIRERWQFMFGCSPFNFQFIDPSQGPEVSK